MKKQNQKSPKYCRKCGEKIRGKSIGGLYGLRHDDKINLAERVIESARQTAYMITNAHNGDESNIPDENALVEAVEALDKAEGKMKP